jgi:hypothetical protein
MKKTSLLAAAAVLALTSGFASAAPSAAVSSHGALRVVPAQNPDAVLYDQMDNDSGIGITSQNFEASLDIYDNMGADDFKVPTGFIWKVSEVDVAGVYYNGAGPAASVHVAFYKSKGGLPSKLVADFPAEVYTDSTGFGSFNIKLSSKAKLKAGKYFVGVAANMDFGVGGQWGFETRSVQSGDPAAWQNPGDGFGTGCTTWGVESVCIVAGQGPDKMFRIIGKSVAAQ